MREIETGTEAIRAALYSRARKSHLAPVARDLNERNLNVGVAALEAFLSGAALAAPILKALAEDMFGGRLVFDPDHDVLRPAIRQEPRTISPPPSSATEPRHYRVGELTTTLKLPETSSQKFKLSSWS